ncbi:hypothetical protein ASC94_23055 [Massilia sp. Root418]|uniref:hypothetical protein n=1 Tax=Massilia sp. Root418 TaxID=1736532 RepID=UPI0007003C14|nr:hypothetical protein [Massilia sp. Root418]KQW89310.1 hypothetical protein ASC94_23055 [Massilia sp. Root418]
MSLIKRIAGLLPARRTLHVHLGPQSLLAVLRQGARIAEGGTLHVGFANPAGQWQVPLAALRALLAQPVHAYAADTLPAAGTAADNRGSSGSSSGGTDGSAGVRGALADRLPMHVSLSGRWCQMLMAPWSDALLSEAGAAHFLETQFAAIYGEAARGWTVGSDDAPYGQPRLACGIATELLDALHALAADHGTRCAAIEPLASTVCASLARDKPEAFAIIEPGRITMSALAKGRVAAVQPQPCSAAWHAELAQAWQRWTLREPGLADIGDIAVVDLSGQPGGLASGQLPGRFRLAASPFGQAASAPPAEGAHAGGKLPLSVVPASEPARSTREAA